MKQHHAVATYSAGVAVAFCACGWRERVEHGTRAMARALADDHVHHARVLDEAQPCQAVG